MLITCRHQPCVRGAHNLLADGGELLHALEERLLQRRHLPPRHQGLHAPDWSNPAALFSWTGKICLPPPPLLTPPSERDWYFIAEQPAPAPHRAHPEGCAALRIVLVNVPRFGRSCEHGFDLHLPPFKYRGHSRTRTHTAPTHCTPPASAPLLVFPHSSSPLPNRPLPTSHAKRTALGTSQKCAVVPRRSRI